MSRRAKDRGVLWRHIGLFVTFCYNYYVFLLLIINFDSENHGK